MIALELRFRDRLRTTFGWGTDATNDLGLRALSLVVKPIAAAGRPCVKLSDNPAKAMGPTTEIARYQRVFGSEPGEYVECMA
jgi:nicotinate phosphoribosyltransferase